MNRLRAPTQEQAGVLIALIAVLFGGWVRLFIPQAAGFPVNDGGLFYIMLRGLQANGLRLPMYVHYNGLNIPFAYPPLGFYAGALAGNLLHIDAIHILQWLPAVVLVTTLPAFYWLARTVLGTSFRAGVATLVFAFTPRAITWQVMGGGLTRSFGQLFMLLALAAIYLTFESYSRKRLVLAILFSTLVVLSHPEAALQAVGIAILFWLIKGRSRWSALHAAEIGAGTLVLSSVWWAPVMIRYGAGTILSAAQTGQHTLLALLEPFLLNFVDEPLLSIVAVFGVIGFAAELAKRRILIPIWLFVPFLVEPRSAPTYAMIPLALLAGVGLADAVLPALARLAGATENPLQSKAASIFLLFVGLYMFGQTVIFGTQVAATRLAPSAIQTFEWIKANTPAGSQFMILTGNSADELFCDAPAEWFPALTDRISMTTVQGSEWLGEGDFVLRTKMAQEAASCLDADAPAKCVQNVTSGRPVDAFGSQAGSAIGSSSGGDYVYVARHTPVLKGCRVTGTSPRGQQLIDELSKSANYTQVYQNADAALFRVR